MTTRAKIAHLLRRFGLGATLAELDRLEPLGVEGALKNLLEYEDKEETYPLSPWEFAFRPKEDADAGAYRFRLYWMAKILTTNRPLQEKLAVFWHNHFAVSDAKVEDGLMMLQYLETLRANAILPFPRILGAASKDPAMMRWLDMYRSLKGNPNENFAREIMELFTLGIGNYSEEDVKAAAKAFTGWSYVNLLWELPGSMNEKLNDMIQYRRPMSSFALLPGLHDSSEKTILAKTGHFDGDDVVHLLAMHPITARRMVKKLWEFFAYEDPEEKVLDNLTGVYLKSEGDTKKVLYAMARSDEFWSDRCVRQLVKSPFDYVIPIARQCGVGDLLRTYRPAGVNETQPTPQQLLDSCGAVMYWMDKMGMALLYPPDVSGWRWGRQWISTSTMVDRIKYREMVLWWFNGELSKTVMKSVQRSSPKTSQEFTQHLLAFLDVDLPPSSATLVQTAMDKAGGLEALKSFDGFRNALEQTMRLIVAAPEMQFC